MNKKNQNSMLKGSAIFIAGKFGGLFLQFLCGILIIRYLPREEYGLFALSYTIINITVVMANLGLNNGLPRMLPNYLAKKQYIQARQAIKTTIILLCATSLLLLAAVYFSAPMLSRIFSTKDLPDVLQKLCFLIPALALSGGLASAFRGIKNAFPQSFFISFLPALLRLPGYLLVVYLGLGLSGVITTQLMTVYISCIGLIIYTKLNFGRSFPHIRSTSSFEESPLPPLSNKVPTSRQHQPEQSVSRDLLLFSLPLMGIFIIDMLTNWSTTLLLGYYETPAAVGALNALDRLIQLIPLPLHAIVFMFLPIATQLIAVKKLDELSQLYTRITKWITLFTIPLAMILIVDGAFVLHFLFNGKYDDLRLELAIMVVGTVFHSFMGPNATTLLAGGKTRILLLNTSINVVICIILALIIIPIFSITGAAISISTALIIGNVLNSIFLYKKYAIHPLKMENIRPILLSIVISVIFLNLSCFFVNNNLMRFVIYFMILLLSIVCPFFTKSIQKEEKVFFKMLIPRIIKNKRSQKWLIKNLL